MAYKKDDPFEYRLIKYESLNENFVRLVTGLTENAISLCNFRAMKDADRRIHEIRKTIKRSRAVLKLYRTAIGEDFYTEQNALFRYISMQLSELRMSAVRQKTMGRLKDQGRLKGSARFYDELIKDMQASHKKRIHETIMIERLHRSSAAVLRDNRNKIKQLKDFPYEFDALSRGLQRMYKRSTVNLHAAMRQPAAENIHNFRKPVKYLWNQMTVLRPLWSPAIGQIIRNLNILGERLGDEHDLAELEHYLWSHHYAEANSIEPLILTIRKERKRIQHNSWPLSMKVFAESPGAYAKRINSYWTLW